MNEGNQKLQAWQTLSKEDFERVLAMLDHGMMTLAEARTILLGESKSEMRAPANAN